ncbi:hypothetical protein SAMN05421493_105153 [Pseudobutyrivibrio sp. 49]|uniref:hypothetical protein n=1 Tax=Pseudobutyrivibrio sp. 49 TaxID=1855344 RepID=UPI000880600B|nr:hypothetical protein [Pseudobutyrivibrio sp. 49]SDH92325.1 hypothetical protein SAMN05421493_105153 [Pseudobutyrivibrio sp. 49]
MKKNIREVHAWPIERNEEYIFFSDRVVGGLYYLKGISEKVKCEITPVELKRIGITMVNSICFFEENIILIPGYLYEPVALYNFKRKSFELIDPLSKKTDTSEKGFVCESKLIIVTHSSNVAIYEIDLLGGAVQRHKYSDGRIHKSWLPFIFGGDIFIPGTDEKKLWKYSSGELYMYDIPINEKIMSIIPDEIEKEKLWLYTTSLERIYGINKEGELLEIINTGIESDQGNLIRIYQIGKCFFLLHSVEGIIIFNKETGKKAQFVLDEKYKINNYKDILPCIYLGLVKEKDKFIFISFANTTIELSYKDGNIISQQLIIELPKEIRTSFIWASMFNYWQKPENDYYKEDAIHTLERYLGYVEERGEI